MDDQFDAAERGTIERLLGARFEMSEQATRDLLARADTIAKQSSQIHPFTRLAVERMTPEERIRLIEMLWEVAYADGVLDPEEEVLLRRVAGLSTERDQAKAGADELKTKVDELTASVATLTGERDQALAKVTELQRAAGEKGDSAATKAKLEALAKQVAALTAERDQLKGKVEVVRDPTDGI